MYGVITNYIGYCIFWNNQNADMIGVKIVIYLYSTKIQLWYGYKLE